MEIVLLPIFSLTAHNQIMLMACILCMAGFGFATVSPTQKLVMRKARAADAPPLASAFNIGLLNLGSAIGAWLGGRLIAAGHRAYWCSATGCLSKRIQLHALP
jgi:DHA1 family inner membrane transport protein